MGTHTPGPWELGEDGVWLGSVYSEDGLRIALVYGEWDIDEPRPREEGEANARLIAATPDLLAALQSFVAAVEDDGEPMPGARWHAECVAARAAIAKAAGAQP